MYNLKNLNDYEYEVLCLDAMSKMLKKKLYRFARGKDGGIDICDNIVEIVTLCIFQLQEENFQFHIYTYYLISYLG